MYTNIDINKIGDCKSCYVIGFTKVYYTKWRITEVVLKDGIRQSCMYIQNLSYSLEEAQKKVKGAEVDTSLKGNYSFERKLSSKTLAKFLPDHCFTFGRLAREDIRICEDVWQLNRARLEENGDIRKEYAKKRLIELGELVLYKGKYMLLKVVEQVKIQDKIQDKINRHYFEDKKRIDLEIKELDRFHFNGMYGMVFVITYETPNGEMVKYVGGSPLRSQNDLGFTDKFYKISATIKHTHYNDKPETHLQRIKIL